MHVLSFQVMPLNVSVYSSQQELNPYDHPERASIVTLNTDTKRKANLNKLDPIPPQPRRDKPGSSSSFGNRSSSVVINRKEVPSQISSSVVELIRD